jgi:ABC-type thiamin/hydroxymethylpyrimidine transport system permease subunit
MKWVLGGLLLALVWTASTGRVSMLWVIYPFSILFASLASALVFAFVRNKHYGLLLLALTYFGSALAAVVLFQWWPLAAGYAAALLMRMLGLEPKYDPPLQSQVPDNENKNS